MGIFQFEDIRGEFVGRRRELDFFTQMVEAGDACRLLVLHGLGGIGKTWLVSRLGQEVVLRSWARAVIDLSVGGLDYLSTLTGLGNQLGRPHDTLFEGKLRHYFELLNTRYVPTAQNLVTQSSAVDTSFSGTVGDVVGQGLAGAHLPGELSVVLDSMRHDLTESFLDSLAERPESKPTVLVFDTFEAIEGTEFGRWLEGFIAEAVSRGQTFCVLAGRNPLKISREFRHRLEQKELSYFEESEIEEYISARVEGLTRSALKAIHRLTKGHPLCVGLAADLVSEHGLELAEQWASGTRTETLTEQMVSRFLTDRILEREDPTLRRGLMTASITRQFDAGTLLEIDALSSSNALLDRLMRFSFVARSSRGGYVMHDVIRELLLAKWCRDDYDGFRSHNARAASYYELKARSSARRAGNQDELDQLHHLLFVDEDAGVAFFEGLYSLAENNQQTEYCEALQRELNSYSRLVAFLDLPSIVARVTSWNSDGED